MIIIIIVLLLFGSVGFLAYKFIPFVIERYREVQKIRMEKEGKRFDQVFVHSQKQHLMQVYTIAPLTLGLLGFILTQNFIGLIAGLFIGLISPPIVMKRMLLQRRDKFQNQLVDGLMLLSSSLKAGMSLTQGFDVLVEEMPAPISEEFALVVRENQMGVDLEECLAHLRQRIPNDDLDLIAIAIGISRESGGNLTEILENLVFTIREKKKLENRVKTLTVQGRLQGYIMMVLPIAFSIFIYFTSPDNFKVMLQDKLGQSLLIWSVVSEGIGIILIKKLSKIEV